ncbi:MAG: hypothetical protein MRY79_08300 [Alphaproteobacteria bacterium]|nr:hypothetical protein [Alphaproteobacteria bacterium]
MIIGAIGKLGSSAKSTERAWKYAVNNNGFTGSLEEFSARSGTFPYYIAFEKPVEYKTQTYIHGAGISEELIEAAKLKEGDTVAVKLDTDSKQVTEAFKPQNI